MPAVDTSSPLCSDKVMESPLPNNSIVLLVQLEGKDPVPAFNISFYYFYLKIKISFIQTDAVKELDRVCDCK